MKFVFLVALIFFNTYSSILAESDAIKTTLDRLAILKTKVKKVTLDNGVRVIMYKRGIAPVFAGSVAVKVGGVDEPPGATGIAHMLEHMAFKGSSTIGTKNYKKEKKLLEKLEILMKKQSEEGQLSEVEQATVIAINIELEKIWDIDSFDSAYSKRGAVGLNAITSNDLTNYFVEFPKTAFEFWAWMESDRIIDPLMRQFYKERDVVNEERRMRVDDSSGGTHYVALLKKAFDLHPYRNPIIGYPEDISKLTATQTYNFQRQYYAPSNIVVSVVGQIDYEKDLKIIKKYFGRIPKAEHPPQVTIKEPKQNKEKSITVYFPALPELALAYKKGSYKDDDDPVLTVLGYILAGGQVSRLYTRLIKQLSKASNVDFFTAPGEQYDNLLIFSLTPSSTSNNQELLRLFDQEVDRLKLELVNNLELEIAKRKLAHYMLGSLDSNMGLANNFARTEVITNNWTIDIDWFNKALAVTPKDIMSYAKQYLNKQTRTIAFLETKK